MDDFRSDTGRIAGGDPDLHTPSRLSDLEV
jgi:hypothetical protein